MEMPGLRDVIIIFLLLFPSIYAATCGVQEALLCRLKKNCGDCLKEHSCCHWCYDSAYNGTKCDLRDNFNGACGMLEINTELRSISTLNAAFTDGSKPIQIKPQQFNVLLRKDSPVNISFSYKAARDYPLELYYLADLSYSMKLHVDILKNLGNKLSESLAYLTKNYTFAFGSFLDKPGMPFVMTSEEDKQNPCKWDKTECNPTYLFKHTLNFTNDPKRFSEAVKNSEISANADDLDGASEAIFQILVCNERFGWTENTRKIIVLSTDSLLHTAGDGLLVGATLRNIDTCLINWQGEHTDPLKYDYPSIADIQSWLSKRQVSLIVAVPEEKISFYQQLEDSLLKKEMFVGVLEANAEKVLDLVSRGFTEFLRQVDFFVKENNMPEIGIRFFADCDKNGVFEEKSACENITAYEQIDFKLELTLKDWMDQQPKQPLIVREKNINVELLIDVQYGGICQCSGFDSTNINCQNGHLNCDLCECDKDWNGRYCESRCVDSLMGCIADNISYFCSGRGECTCGQCECQLGYDGEFCQYACPMNNFLVCSNHGRCSEGKCICNQDYAGDDCSCSQSTESCKFGSDILCNGNGECLCDTCNCYPGYSGAYCEKLISDNKNIFCEEFEKILKSMETDALNVYIRSDNTTIHRENIDESIYCDHECTYVNSEPNRCTLQYCYNKRDDNHINLSLKPKHCSGFGKATGYGLAIAIFTIILGGGLVGIFIKKYQVYKLDQAEYKRFKDSSKFQTEETNPLYKSPIQTYQNPLNRTTIAESSH